MSKKNQEYAPSSCTFDQLLTIRRDNISVGDFSILTDATTVWLSEQAVGHSPTQRFAISRRDFNRLIRWYQTPQKRIRKLPRSS